MSRYEIVIHSDHPDAETVCTDVARTAAEQLDDGHPFEVTLFPIGTDGHSGDAIAAWSSSQVDAERRAFDAITAALEQLGFVPDHASELIDACIDAVIPDDNRPDRPAAP